MIEFKPSRRDFISASAATLLAAGIGTRARAASSIVATTYPGSWEAAHRSILIPAFTKASGADVSLQTVQALEAITKITASRDNPPFDVVILDEGPFLAALDLGIFAPMPVSKVKNLAEVPERFIDPNGFGAFVSAQILGIVYNPAKIKTPPTSWLDLWKPEYKGRVGITGLASSLGTAWLVEIAKLHGGSEANLDPGFDAINKLLPNVGAIAPNPGALATLFQQGQIDISFNYLNSVLPLVSRGVDIAIAKPDSGWVLIRNSMHIIKNTANYDLACTYVDTALSTDVQAKMASAPNYLASTNRQVPFQSELAKVAKDNEALSKLTLIDWKTINPKRGALIERFNRDVRI